LAAKKPGGGTTTASCPGPKSTANLPTYDNAGAFATPISGGFDYFFTSTASDPLPSGGVPGLVKYCVYPSDAKTAPDVAGDTYNNWVASTSPKSPYPFSFGRDGGNNTNVPLDGNNPVPIGTATWDPSTDAPSLAGQTIVLHIADPDFCGTSPTCFVKPGAPICNAGDGNTEAAYNAIPTDFLRCEGPGGLGFEAVSTSEFGDRVGLDIPTGNGGNLQSMTVDFQSYGCGTTGHWNTAVDRWPDPLLAPGNQPDPCVTNPGDEFFTIPPSGTDPAGIRANIYAVGPNDANGFPTVGAKLATATYTLPIPYRPSADPTCTGADAGKFRNLAGTCVNSQSVLIPFTGFTAPGGGSPPAFTDGQEVIWTVAFNTTHHGYNPIAGAACATASTPEPDFPTVPGCGYDSLNVGAKTYPNANALDPNTPYAGTDVQHKEAVLNSSVAGFYCDNGLTATGPGGTGTLRLDTDTVTTPNDGVGSDGTDSPTDCWTGFRPLATIVTG
jgi:hypothetical protein